MAYKSKTGVKGLRIDVITSRYYVRIWRREHGHIFGGYFPLTAEGFAEARDALARLLRQYPEPKRERNLEKPRSYGVRPQARSRGRKLPTTGVRFVYENGGRYYVNVQRDGRAHYGGTFPLTPEGLRDAERAALQIQERLLLAKLAEKGATHG